MTDRVKVRGSGTRGIELLQRVREYALTRQPTPPAGMEAPTIALTEEQMAAAMLGDDRRLEALLQAKADLVASANILRGCMETVDCELAIHHQVQAPVLGHSHPPAGDD